MRARRLLGEVPKAEGAPCSAQGEKANKKAPSRQYVAKALISSKVPHTKFVGLRNIELTI